MGIFKDCNAELARPRHDAKHHNYEGQGENRKDKLVLTCELCIFRNIGGISHKMLFIFGFLVINYRLFRVFLDLFCVIHNENTAESNADNENYKAKHKTVTDGDIGKARCDTCCEWVNCRAECAEACAESDNIDTDNRVIAHCDENRDENEIECHGFFPHTEGCTAECEDAHKHRNEQMLLAA